ncbi:MAG TPA: stage II sporulation protein R [Candidatus Pullichristensenella excrementigallinarum]|uniref:Stage II sporulation protein R n=1 Tax=Candidatus Pullichristensenella excrementigallinarum TaxID=2840907 RepID=A0A9D1I978_9FIRM|nr:stage II sporulation protein R [Candidatus Pullichristensenella excrementigallinarum]
MDRRLFFALFLLVLALWIAPTASAACNEDFVRLHVVAEGDSEWEQFVKLRVRDACLDQAQALLASCPNADAAWEVLNEHLPDFEEAAEKAARENGFSGEITIETGIFAFPDRLYGEAFVPAGDYRALRVVLGEGQGHNWWCVLYPSLCVLDEQAYVQADQSIEFYSSIGRLFDHIFGGN